MKTRDYNIGGLTVEMTEAQAERWNAGQLTDEDETTARVWLPDEYEYGYHVRDGEIIMHIPRIVRGSRAITLAEAYADEELAGYLDGNPAELMNPYED